MKRICVALMLMLQMSMVSYGAVSEDMSVYVRKDVFEVHMQNINGKFDSILEELKLQRQSMNELTQAVSALTERVTVLSERIDRNFDTLNGRINGTERALSERVDGIDERMSDLRNDIYLWLVILGIVVALPSVQKYLESREKRKPVVTLEDVRRLIEENNAKLMETLKV